MGRRTEPGLTSPQTQKRRRDRFRSAAPSCPSSLSLLGAAGRRHATSEPPSASVQARCLIDFRDPRSAGSAGPGVPGFFHRAGGEHCEGLYDHLRAAPKRRSWAAALRNPATLSMARRVVNKKNAPTRKKLARRDSNPRLSGPYPECSTRLSYGRRGRQGSNLRPSQVHGLGALPAELRPQCSRPWS